MGLLGSLFGGGKSSSSTSTSQTTDITDNTVQVSEGGVALSGGSTIINSDRETVSRALDSVDRNTAASTSIAAKSIDAASLFASKASESQNDIIDASTSLNKSAYDFALEASKSGDERLTTNIVKYALWAGVAIVGFFILAPIFRPKAPAK